MDGNLSISSEQILSTFMGTFKSMSQEKKFNILQTAIAASDGYVKWRVKSWLSLESAPDLLTLLPPEIQFKILEMVDGSSLLRASQVSKSWYNILENNEKLWKLKSQELGVNIDEKPPDMSWKTAFALSRKQLHYMGIGNAFNEKIINLQNCKKPIKAIDYCEGYLCSVSDEDRVTIWHLELNFPVLSFLAIPAVSCIKFNPNTTLICGHFNGILTAWDLSDMSKHHCREYTASPPFLGNDRDYSEFCLLKARFQMHIGPVYSCDFSETLKLVVSGSVDEMIKFWCLVTGDLLRTLSCKNHWVLKIILIPFCKGNSVNSIVTMTRESVDKFDWKCKKNDICGIGEVLDFNRGDLKDIIHVSKIKLNQNNDNFITPGLQMSSKFIGLVKQDLQEKHANLVVLHANDFKLFKEIPLSFKVRKLLAIGNRYALMLTVGKVLYTSTLIIIDLFNGKVVGTDIMPHSKMTTPDGAQIIVGDTRWLDGLSGWDKLGNILLVTNPREIEEQKLKRKLKKAMASYPGLLNELCAGSPYFDVGLDKECYDKLHVLLSPVRPENKITRNLVLAAGIRDDVGRIFTLWWKGNEPDKTKVE